MRSLEPKAQSSSPILGPQSTEFESPVPLHKTVVKELERKAGLSLWSWWLVHGQQGCQGQASSAAQLQETKCKRDPEPLSLLKSLAILLLPSESPFFTATRFIFHHIAPSPPPEHSRELRVCSEPRRAGRGLAEGEGRPCCWCCSRCSDTFPQSSASCGPCRRASLTS